VYCATLLCLYLQWARAEETNAPQAEPVSFTVGDLFTRGRYEASFTAGVLFSPVGKEENRPTVNYTVTGVQLGRMMGNVRGAGFWRGNLELALEGFGGWIYDGPGNYVGGATLWVRWNFVPEGWRVIPYIQGGAGVTTTDIDRNLVGQPFNFNLDLGAGLRYYVARRCSVNLEYRYQHISNADTGVRNVGVNSQGPILSISYFF
jgi:opacity protein-like surface antigen